MYVKKRITRKMRRPIKFRHYEHWVKNPNKKFPQKEWELEGEVASLPETWNNNEKFRPRYAR